MIGPPFDVVENPDTHHFGHLPSGAPIVPFRLPPGKESKCEEMLDVLGEALGSLEKREPSATPGAVPHLRAENLGGNWISPSSRPKSHGSWPLTRRHAEPGSRSGPKSVPILLSLPAPFSAQPDSGPGSDEEETNGSPISSPRSKSEDARSEGTTYETLADQECSTPQRRPATPWPGRA